jgi:hypothetical protein
MPMKDGEFVPSAPPYRVGFRLTDVSPPSPLYIQLEDVLTILFLGDFSPRTITVSGRILLPEGKIQVFQRTFNYTATVFQVQQFQMQLAEGFLLGVTATAGSSLGRGSTFARMYISRSTASVPLSAVSQLLAGDYITASAPLTWPGGRCLFGAEGPGLINPLTGISASAGAQFTTTVPSGSDKWRLQSLQATLTTSATVANRFVSLSQSTGGNAVEVGFATAQTAGTAITYHFSTGVPNGTIGAGKVQIGLPQSLFLPSGGVIASVVVGMDATDAWSNIRAVVEQWIDY